MFSPGLFIKAGSVSVMKSKLFERNVRNKINLTLLKFCINNLSEPGTKYLGIFRADLTEH